MVVLLSSEANFIMLLLDYFPFNLSKEMTLQIVVGKFFTDCLMGASFANKAQLCDWLLQIYRKVSNIRLTKFQNTSDSRTVLHVVFAQSIEAMY